MYKLAEDKFTKDICDKIVGTVPTNFWRQYEMCDRNMIKFCETLNGEYKGRLYEWMLSNCVEYNLYDNESIYDYFTSIFNKQIADKCPNSKDVMYYWDVEKNFKSVLNKVNIKDSIILRAWMHSNLENALNEVDLQVDEDMQITRDILIHIFRLLGENMWIDYQNKTKHDFFNDLSRHDRNILSLYHIK